MAKNRYRELLVSIFSISLLLTTSSLSAQTKEVRGEVRSESTREALVGVTIVVEGSQIGTSTDLQGEFVLQVPDSARKLKVSYVGYRTRIVSIDSGRKLSIRLQEDDNLLEDVVVVGYGTMRKSDLTGSVSSIQVDETEAMSSPSIQSILQGRASGIEVVSGDGAPGSAVNIKIRGTSSLTGSGEPLYVVDGIIMNSVLGDVSMQGSSALKTNFSQMQNGLTGISPSDIASIEILKDASATAIYGSLGANGVVLITTKMGNSEKPKIQYNGSISVAHMVNKREMCNLQEYAEYRSAFLDAPYDVSQRKEMDWQDEISQLAISNNHRVSLSGRTRTTNYYIAGGYMNNEGVIKSTRNEQIDFRVNLDQKLSKVVTIGTKSSFMYTNTNMTQGADNLNGVNSGLIRQALILRPFDPNIGPQDEDTVDENGNIISDPRDWLKSYKDESREYRALVSAYLQFRFSKHFDMKTTVGMDYRDKMRRVWFEPPIYQGTTSNGIANAPSLVSSRINVDHMFNYQRTFGKHRLNAVVGGTLSTTYVKNSIVSTTQFNGLFDYGNDGFLYGTSDDAMNYNTTKVNTVSGLARFIYNYDERYILTATFRADGTSKFAKGNKFSYFPSFAFAYRLNQEPFMRNVEFISNLKLRLGWGQVGNQAVGAYQTLTTFGSDQYANPNGGYDIAVYRNILPNPLLKWETTSTYNVGLDLGLFNQRLNLTVDLYDKQSTDLLQKINISTISGFSSMYVNRGSIQNRGLELSLDAYVIDRRDFKLSVAGNISFNRNKITDIGLADGVFGAHTFKAMTGSQIGSGTYLKDYVNIFIEGKPVGLFFGQKVDGIIQQHQIDADLAYRDEQIRNANPDRDFSVNPITDAERIAVKGLLPVYGGILPTAGDPNYVDVNGDGKADTNDRTIIGDPNPKFTYGFSLSAEYKNLFLSAVFNGSYGNQIVNANRYSEEDVRFGTYNISKEMFYNYYREDRPSTTHPRLQYNGSSQYLNSMFVEDGSFLRFSSATLGYNWILPKGKTISSIAFSLTVRNLFCLTKYKGYDPEVSTFVGDPMRVGIDWSSYPNNRTYTFNVSLSF